MTTTLSEGVKVPDVGSVNWAGDLEVNWNLLNGALANLSGNVKTDRDNTWTGEQSFTLPIVGSITGTASKAIADEDGTSIKTGYVNVAGNQTVSSQKTWSGNQFYTAGAYHRNNSYEIGNTPASNVAIPIYFTDKVNAHTGYVRNVILTTGKTQSELYARNKFTSGALSPTGTDVSSTLQVEVQSNGDKTLYFDGSIRNNVLPYATNTYALGSSSYQWSSVYAQTYYYNGTEFSNKFVTIDTEQTITSLKTLSTAGSPQLRVKSTSIDLTNTMVTSYRTISIRAIDKNDTTLGQISWNYKASDNTGRLNLTQTSRDGVLGGVIIQHNGSNSTTDIMPYDTTNDHNLGTSTNKWKTLNGVNPGALSLPSSSYVEIDTTNWDLTGATSQSYTPAVHGWLFVSIQNIAGNYLSIVGGRGAVSMDGTGAQAGLRAALPAVANESVSITVKTGSIFAARFYPMLGNV